MPSKNSVHVSGSGFDSIVLHLLIHLTRLCAKNCQSPQNYHLVVTLITIMVSEIPPSTTSQKNIIYYKKKIQEKPECNEND